MNKGMQVTETLPTRSVTYFISKERLINKSYGQTIVKSDCRKALLTRDKRKWSVAVFREINALRGDVILQGVSKAKAFDAAREHMLFG